MSESNPDPRTAEHDPRAELGLENPVRDQERMGDSKYSVTPPRSKVRAPQQSEGGKVSCKACSTELDSAESYRMDGKEYAYHFCGAQCYERWRGQSEK